jgi:hypothetical protein
MHQMRGAMPKNLFGAWGCPKGPCGPTAASSSQHEEKNIRYLYFHDSFLGSFFLSLFPPEEWHRHFGAKTTKAKTTAHGHGGPRSLAYSCTQDSIYPICPSLSNISSTFEALFKATRINLTSRLEPLLATRPSFDLCARRSSLPLLLA